MDRATPAERERILRRRLGQLACQMGLVAMLLGLWELATAAGNILGFSPFQ
jgi:hypothetical protein